MYSISRLVYNPGEYIANGDSRLLAKIREN